MEMVEAASGEADRVGRAWNLGLTLLVVGVVVVWRCTADGRSSLKAPRVLCLFVGHQD